MSFFGKIFSFFSSNKQTIDTETHAAILKQEQAKILASVEQVAPVPVPEPEPVQVTKPEVTKPEVTKPEVVKPVPVVVKVETKTAAAPKTVTTPKVAAQMQGSVSKTSVSKSNNDDDFFNPLNPLSPIGVINPISPISVFNADTSGSCKHESTPSYSSGSSSSYSSGSSYSSSYDSSSSSSYDSGSSSSSCD